LFVAFGVSPVVAFAEESVETPEISVEIETSEEVIEETESVENTPVETPKTEEEKTKLTYEDILAITGEIMKQEGFENKWDKALYYMETAASEKKVDLMIAVGIIIVVLLAVYIGGKIILWNIKKKNDTTSSDIKAIKTASGQQTTAINGLIDEGEKLEKVSTDAVEREKDLAKSIALQNTAIRCLIRGTKIEQALKDEAYRALNESDECCDKAKK
jgi:hypothetical protein